MAQISLVAVAIINEPCEPLKWRTSPILSLYALFFCQSAYVFAYDFKTAFLPGLNHGLYSYVCADPVRYRVQSVF